MSSPIHITDLADPALNDYRNLTDVQLRRRIEPVQGLYMAESTKVITRALRAGHQPRSLLLSDKWAEQAPELVATFCDLEAPVYVGSPQVLEAITGFNVHRGAIAAMHRPAPRAVQQIITGARTVFVLEDIVDHTNVGAIFRSAAGLGVDAIVLSPRCADPLYRRSVRVSMGAVFQVPWARLEEWPDGLGMLRDAGLTVAALALADDAQPLDEFAAAHDRVALVLGTEGDGLSRRTLAQADLVVTMPMQQGVDSLNVAAASAVAAWELRPRRGTDRL